MQIVSNRIEYLMHIVSSGAHCLQWRQFAKNVQSCSLWKIRKKYQFVVCWNSQESGKGQNTS